MNEQQSTAKHGLKVHATHLEADEREKARMLAMLEIDNLITIRGLAVKSGQYGDYVTYPQYKDKDGQYHPVIDFNTDKDGKLTDASKSLKHQIESTLLTMSKSRATKHENPPPQTPDYSITAYANLTRKEDSAIKAIGSLYVGDLFKINCVKVCEKKESGEKFVAMPSTLKKDGTYEDKVYFTQSELRDKAQSAMLSKYERQLAHKNETPAQTPPQMTPNRTTTQLR